MFLGEIKLTVLKMLEGGELKPGTLHYFLPSREYHGMTANLC